MRAVINTPDAADAVTISEAEEARPAANEALVDVRAFSINRGELALLQRRAQGWRPGQDVAGVVAAAAADGSGPSAGTRVVGLVEGAGWSERVAVPTNRLAPLPSSVSCEQAATLPIAGLTALRLIRLGGSLLGRRVLVTGANGGVGRFLIELAVAAGAQVTAVTHREAQIKELRQLGAATVVRDVADADGLFDLIPESVGGSALSDAIGKVAPNGTVVVYGNSSGDTAALSVYDFFGHEQARLVNYMSYASTDPIDQDLAILVDLIAADRLHPTIGHTADWAELPTALDMLRERKHDGGKIVLTIN
jgi:NADPH2:quinone reductase